MGNNNKVMSDMIRAKKVNELTATTKPEKEHEGMNAFIRSTRNDATARFNKYINGTSKEQPKKQEPETDPQYEYLQNRVNTLNKLVEAEQKLEALSKGE